MTSAVATPRPTSYSAAIFSNARKIPRYQATSAGVLPVKRKAPHLLGYSTMSGNSLSAKRN
eukprot:2483691-Lingulodinium_polyedra.AAC.1